MGRCGLKDLADLGRGRVNPASGPCRGVRSVEPDGTPGLAGRRLPGPPELGGDSRESHITGLPQNPGRAEAADRLAEARGGGGGVVNRPPDPLDTLLRSAVAKAKDPQVKAWLQSLLDHGEPAKAKPPAKKTPKGAKRHRSPCPRFGGSS
jgi:hypothetical protein